MRVGLVILPEARWSAAAAWWTEAEAMGFDHLWTYDHLGWRTLVDHPWFDAVGTLVAAATVTEHVPLGTLVSSPNTRRLPSFVREITTIDDVSDGRFRLGLGSGGTGNYDNDVFGEAPVTTAERTRQFEEFVVGLDRLLTHDRATVDGAHIRAIDARSTPGCIQQPRIPFVIGALGPRAMRLAVDHGQAWVTTGMASDTDDEFWHGVADLQHRFDEILGDRPPIDRMLLLGAATPTSALESRSAFEDQLGRADALGFTDIVIHRPRAEGIYKGSMKVLEEITTEVLPALRQTAGSGR